MQAEPRRTLKIEEHDRFILKRQLLMLTKSAPIRVNLDLDSSNTACSNKFPSYEFICAQIRCDGVGSAL